MNIKIIGKYIITLLLFAACRGEQKSTPNLKVVQPLPAKTSVIFYGDTRGGHAVHRKLVQLFLQNKPLAIFHSGDLVFDARIPLLWDTFFTVTKPMCDSFPFYAANGNHEHGFENITKHLPKLTKEWYLVTINDINVFVLNTASPLNKNSKQYNWLDSSLTAVKNPKALNILMFHYPLFSTGHHGLSDSKTFRADIIKLCETRNVKLVFNGHDHDYERTLLNGINYVVAGGGGAPLGGQSTSNPNSVIFKEKYCFCRLYKVNNKWTVDTIDENGQVYDIFTVN